MEAPKMRRVLSHKVLLIGAALAAGVAVTACVPPKKGGPPPTTQVPPPPLPKFVERAAWLMNEAGGSTMADSVAPPQNGVIGSDIKPTGSVYEFPGWVNSLGPDGVHISPTATVSETGGKIVVADPNHLLEPKNGIFSVSGVIRARLTATGVLPDNDVPGTSFNVVQKAHQPNPGGYWKVEVNASGNQKRGKLLCTVGDGVHEVSAASTVRLDDGAWHNFRCWLAQNKLVSEVDGHQSAVDASSVNTVNPVGKYSNEVVIGKKPGSTDPDDSFSGWLGELHIATG
jgi:hypothetical protein